MNYPKGQKKSPSIHDAHTFQVTQKTFAQDAEEGLDSSVSDFDVEHFCNGSPIRCYYYRASKPNKK